MSDQTARRVAIQHEVSALIESSGEPLVVADEERVARLLAFLSDAVMPGDWSPTYGRQRALLYLQAEAQLWSESLMSEAAK